MSIIGGLIVSSLIGTAYSMELDEKAAKKYAKAYDKQYASEELVRKKREEADNSMVKLANRKRAILSTSINDFIELYSQIKKINFVETDVIRELDNKLQLSENIVVMKDMVHISKTKVGITDEDVVKAYLMSGILGAAFVKDSKENLNQANSQMRVANVMYSQAQTFEVTLNGIIQRCENFSDLITKLNLLFVKSIKHCKTIIYEKQYNKFLYTEDDRKALMTCMNLASAIKKLIDTPLLDEKGEITQKSLEAIETGNAYLNEIQNTI